MSEDPFRIASFPVSAFGSLAAGDAVALAWAADLRAAGDGWAEPALLWPHKWDGSAAGFWVSDFEPAVALPTGAVYLPWGDGTAWNGDPMVIARANAAKGKRRKC